MGLTRPKSREVKCCDGVIGKFLKSESNGNGQPSKKSLCSRAALSARRFGVDRSNGLRPDRAGRLQETARGRRRPSYYRN